MPTQSLLEQAIAADKEMDSHLVAGGEKFWNAYDERERLRTRLEKAARKFKVGQPVRFYNGKKILRGVVEKTTRQIVYDGPEMIGVRTSDGGRATEFLFNVEAEVK